MTFQEYLPYFIAAAVGAGPGIFAWVKFIMSIGELKAEVLEARSSSAAANARAILVENHLSEYKVSVAEKYATARDLLEAETRTANSIESLRTELRTLSSEILRALMNKANN